ncbi:hypothetical protein N8891_03055 [Flavobacteriales bacterium]|nr:hypothetical protein [Flavobacteriales bacterium]
MKHLLTVIACFFALSMSAQALYNPDVDGDGCITVTDVLGVLSLFNTCEEGSTLYYFRSQGLMLPFWEQNIMSPTMPFYLLNDTGEAQGTEDFAVAFQWALDHQGELFPYEFEGEGENTELSVCPIDSVMNVSVPLATSIPNGLIVFEETESPGRHYFVIKDDVNFSFADTPVFYPLAFNCGNPSALMTPIAFNLNDENWTLYEVGGFSPTSSQITFNVLCGY